VPKSEKTLKNRKTQLKRRSDDISGGSGEVWGSLKLTRVVSPTRKVHNQGDLKRKKVRRILKLLAGEDP